MTSRRTTQLLLAGEVLALTGGGILALADFPTAAAAVWAAGAVAALLPLLVDVVRDLRERQPGVDVVALLAIAAALALGEFLAAAMIGLMLATGRALEEYAGHRAERELTALLARAPRVAHRYHNGELETITAGDVAPGDRLLVKPGEVLPADGVVGERGAVLDESTITGEARPVERTEGDRVSSGTVNVGGPFEMRALAGAADSTYAGIVRLVATARTTKAPFVRMADRYAAAFVPIALALAAVAWIVSGDPVRALAVLVVATPCPLLIAAPVAIVAGISRAARRGIIVKGGGALETLARGEQLLFDKTGTLTVGEPVLSRVVPLGPDVDEPDMVRLAASVDQASSHVFAVAIVKAARRRGLRLEYPSDVVEEHGAGASGTVEGRRVRVGSLRWVCNGMPSAEAVSLRRRLSRSGGSTVWVAVDDLAVGALVLEDQIRPDSPLTIRRLRREGLRPISMLTGDHPRVAESVGGALGVDRVLAERNPAEKIEAVREATTEGVTIMVGDGINDAPALAAADVGVAMGARGATASSEAADVVLLVDRLDRLVDAIRIARRSRRFAIEAVVLGMGLSFAAMAVASVGLLPPVAGAIAQEGIDAVAIVWALRALIGDGVSRAAPRLPADMAARLRHEHQELIPMLDRIRDGADRLDALPPGDVVGELRAMRSFLTEVIVPHEQEDEHEVYPAIAAELPGADPLAALSRTHQEIFHLVRLYEALVDDLGDDAPSDGELGDLRRILYGLHAILRLHFAQEEELYLSLNDAYLEGPAQRSANSAT